jgi:hypothetical protein
MAQLLQVSDCRCGNLRQPLKVLMFIPETSKCAVGADIKGLLSETSAMM